MWVDNTESEPGAQSLQFQAHPTPPCASACLKLPSKLFCGDAKNRFGRAMRQAFVCAHARSYVCMRHENVFGSFETPCCFRNVRTLHEVVRVRKVVTRSLPRSLLVFHMQTYENKKACSHVSLRARAKNEARSPEKSASLDSSHD